MMQQHTELWAKILNSKYGGWRALAEGKRVNNESTWWQDLMAVLHEQRMNTVLQTETEWKVGCGDKIRFWEDPWTGGREALMTKYPRLYQNSCQQQQVIQQMGSQTGTAWEWNLEWRRPLFDNEVDAAVSFMEEISQIPIHQQITDCWIWKPEPSGHYSTRSAYHLLQGGTAEESLDEALVDLWKLQIPAKASIFAWRLIRDRLPTKDNLRRRQIQMNDTMCPFCRSKEEKASHLFFDCPKTKPLWWESLSWTKTMGVFSTNPKQHFMQQPIGINGGRQYSRWKCWWMALTWTIWQHRNRTVFLKEPFNGSKLLEDAVFLVWSWLRELEKDFVEPYNYWSSNLPAAFCI
ncbi:putative ribonuclease H protein [Glycine soja]